MKAKTTIKLDESNEMIGDNFEFFKVFNKYFVNIVEKLGLFTKKTKVQLPQKNSLGKVEIPIATYGNHPSIIVITEKK